MKKIIFISLGGFIGAILRFIIKESPNYLADFPLNLLIINILGCFLFVFFLTITKETRMISQNLKLGITIGLFGALTTFSTFCKDTILLLNNGKYSLGIFNIIFSVLGGIAFAFLGIKLALIIKGKKQKEKEVR